MGRRRTSRFWLLASGLMLFFSSGCGYSLAGKGSFLPEYIRIIGIPQCLNQGSAIFNIDTVLTERVRQEFLGRRKYRTQPTILGADAILTCAILSTSFSPTAFTGNQQASRYAFVITAKIEFRDVKEDKVIWANPSMQVREEYEVSTSSQVNDQAAFFGQDQNALGRMAQTFARTVVTSILEAF
jgi:hypothetical protein